ncbi:hypothetical protein [Natronoarchaeum rubrum]|uniref:hypothetical protein n=1 Tax=Natronoarchaeum rubrum TaxID=755311 RepID=UPI0021130F91|nr:hypothetical protein [Natronoarchaeum rubrum]
MLIEEPEAIVEGMIALFELIQQEGANTVQILVDSYVKQFQQKQAQNNPYGSLREAEHSELYKTFRENWYTGYAAGFLAKLTLGGSAQSALKSSKQVQRIGSRLSDTGALRALTRISDAKHALKAKATARILLTVDGAAEPVLSRADTAGQAYRLWRLQRGIDADIDALPEAKQTKLGRMLARTDEDGATFVDEVSPETTRIITDGGRDVDAAYRTAVARASRQDIIDSYDQLDRAVRKIDRLENSRIAKEVVADTGAHGLKFIDEMPEQELRALFGQVDSDVRLDHTDLSRFIRNSDGHASWLIKNRFSRGSYTSVLKLSDQNQQITRNILVDGEIRGKSRFVHDEIVGDEVVKIARKFEQNEYGSKAGFADVRVIAGQPNGNGMFMTKQATDHAIERHIFGEDVGSSDVTTFYPTGNVIDRAGIDGPAKLPNTMGMSNRQLRNEIQDMAYRSIKNSNSNGGSITYEGISRHGIESVEVNVNAERVRSVYPSTGPLVRRWNGDEWQKWDSGWVEWNTYQP